MAIFALLAGFFANIGPDRAQAATTERVVVNHYSGLAIEGFDPVAYFTDSLAVQGQADFEAAASGAVWRFRNEAIASPSSLIRKSTGLSSAAMIQSISDAA
jgi:hypothetical protein